VTEKPVGQQVISAKTALPDAQMLESVVSPEGTAVAGPGAGLPRGRQDRHRAEGHQRPLLADPLRRQLRRHRADVEPALHHRRDDRRPERPAPHRRRVAAPTFAALAANALRAANVPPDSTVTDIIIPEHPLEESNVMTAS
jgi:cell division protein FtsI (penicillin-binding protein 3)